MQTMKFKYRCALCLAPIHTPDGTLRHYERTCKHRGAILVDLVGKRWANEN
jgi:hypothetical protein